MEQAIKLFYVRFSYGGHNTHVLMTGKTKKGVRTRFFKEYNSKLVDLKNIQVLHEIDGYKIVLEKN